jgi:hypothetical protein
MSATTDARKSEEVNKIAIETLSLGTHHRAGESSPVLGTPTEVMQHIGELTVWPEYLRPRNIILAGGLSGCSLTRTIEKMEIGEGGEIMNSQFLSKLPFTIDNYSAVTLGTIGTDESKGLLIGGWFHMVANNEDDFRKTIEFELSTENWDTDRPKTKHRRTRSTASILPDGSPAICGGWQMLSQKSTEIRGECGEWNLTETAILHLGRWNHGTTVVNGSMFAVGGLSGDEPTKTIEPTNTVEMWDPRDKSGWKNDSSVPSMIENLESHSVSSIDESIFVFGGCPIERDWLDSCESLDIRSNKWKSISSMPLGRSEHSSVVIGDQILIVGGYPHTTQIDSYDPTTNIWTTLQHDLLRTHTSFEAFAL